MRRIHGDFKTFDEKGRMVLPRAHWSKTKRDDLEEGLHVIVWDASLEAEGVLEFENEMWRARLIPGTRRKRSGELNRQLSESNAEKDFGTGG